MIKIFHLQKMTLQDFPNKVACIVFLSGCNFRCNFCHNPATVAGDKENISEQEFFDFLDSRKGKLDGVVISGGEPTIYGEKLITFMQKIKARDFAIKLDTNGSNPVFLKKMYKLNLLNYVAMDIKCPFEKYGKVTSAKNVIQKIKDSIKLIIGSKIDYEFRTTAYPGLDLADFKEMFSYVKGCKRYIIQKYAPDVTLDLQKPLVIYGKDTLNKIKDTIGSENGAIFVRD